MTDKKREKLADLLMSESVLNTDKVGREYAYAEADAILTEFCLLSISGTRRYDVTTPEGGFIRYEGYAPGQDRFYFDVKGEWSGKQSYSRFSITREELIEFFGPLMGTSHDTY